MSKRNCCPQITLALLFLLNVSVRSAEPIWRGAGAVPEQTGDAGRWIRPERFHAVHLNPTALRDSLERAPREFTPAAEQASAVIELPMPDGSLARFRVCESPIMAPELAAQFPEIKTYNGQGIDDPAATIRFDTTPAGLHAQILSPGGAIYIDPYRPGDATLHQSYSRRDYRRDVEGFRCMTEANAAPEFQPAGAPPGFQSGGTLRTFRLAVSATGEYTRFHGGTVASGLAAIVTAVNRVNGIYETELAIRLVLVANNDLIVFTNPATDPFSNNNPNSLLSQNQTTIDSLIGSANYDLGHCFSTGAGGLSVLSSICRNGSKAQSATGLPMPVGDAYYVDFVAHEIAHEIGASHSYNGVNLNCGAQVSPASAYEPGSGSTIMGYAGLCGTDDLQPQSDPYFHWVSAAEIQYSLTFGLGSLCAASSATGNTAPNVQAGPDFTIPQGTPFTLTATGSDPNGDPLTYCWEERDRGPAQSLSDPDNGSSPLFRSFPPTTNASRTFPKLFDILNQITTPGEKMPAVSRTLNFRVTVRDKRAGGGGVSTDDMVVNVVGSAGPFQVTSPNTSVTWFGARTVTWSVAGTTASPISAAHVDLLLSTNGGASFPVVLAAATPNDGSENIVLPNLATPSARLKVRATGNVFFDISDANFTITPFTPSPQLVLDSATLIAEDCAPANHALDPDEVVTVSFALKNVGTENSTNLTATLVASGGVVPLSGPQVYGTLAVGGPAVAQSFSFLPLGLCGGQVTTTLQLQDGALALGTVTSQFTLGSPACCANPAPPELAISDASVIEGNSGATNVQFNVALSRPVGQIVSVSYATSDGSALAGSDYVATNGSIQFDPGQTNRSVRVAVLGDPLFETSETFALTLTGSTQAVLGRSVGTGTIVDDEIQLSAATLVGADLGLQFNTLTGRNYRVERTDELSATNLWTAVPGAELLPGTGGLVPVVDTNALTQPRRFYRVRQVEP